MGEDSQSYVLKDIEDEELVRLGFQHQVWLQETEGVIKKAGFGSGETLLDLGSGPGYLSFDLCNLVGSDGQVIAVDNSKRFVEHIRREALEKKHGNLNAEVADIRNLEIGENFVDGAITRWVLMFVDDPEAVIKKVARTLKPKGVFAAMEYFQFRNTSLFPRSESYEKVYHAVYELIKRAGGDADIGGRIPKLFIQNGFHVLDVYPILRVGRPGSPLWKWLEATSKNHDKLVEAGLITQEELDEYHHDWNEHVKYPGAFFTAPPILVTIGEKAG